MINQGLVPNDLRYSYANEDTSELPKKNRQCTDVVCAVLLLTVILGGIGCGVYGLNKGDLGKLFQPFDSEGNACGKGPSSDYPLLFFAGSHDKDFIKKTICVKTCPKSDSDALDCYPNSRYPNCDSVKAYESTSFAKRFCWPIQLSTQPQKEEKSTEFRELKTEVIVGDLAGAWPIYLISILITSALALFFISLLEKCAMTMIKILIGIYSFFMFALGGVFFIKYIIEQSKNNSQAEDLQNSLLVGAIIVWMILLIFLCVLYCSWQRVQLASVILTATADYIGGIKRITLVPVLLIVVMLVNTAMWIYPAAHIFTDGEVQHDPEMPFGTIKRSPAANFILYFHGASFLWTTFFFDNLWNFALSGVAVIWYFAKDRNNLGSPISKVFGWGVFYHFGTVAFGSFVLACIFFVKMVLETLKSAAKR